MAIKTFFGWLLKAPLILLNVATLGVGIYAATGAVEGFQISWGAPILIASLQIAYLIGAWMVSSARKNSNESNDTETYEDTSNQESQ